MTYLKLSTAILKVCSKNGLLKQIWLSSGRYNWSLTNPLITSGFIFCPHPIITIETKNNSSIVA